MYVLLFLSIFNIIFIRNREGLTVGISGGILSIILIICDITNSNKLKADLFPFFIISILLFIGLLIHSYLKSIYSYINKHKKNR